MATAFEAWFKVEFDRRLRDVRGEIGLLSSGLPLESASWDRRAAYLLWDALGRPAGEPARFEDLLG